MIQAKISVDIQQAIAAGKQIIYDATNAKKAWRSELLHTLEQFNNLQVIGWYLETPLKICYQRNRKRQVPSEVIQTYYHALEQLPPSKDEGFTKLHHIPYDQLESIDFSRLIS
ncbi:hypothetical protein D082_10140 [Synechocystis sp. PCC 6714]|nr:hypothetical protein D082_10140 [Synechocystis sp. PCC 6714]